MNAPIIFTDAEVIALMDQPAILTKLPDGSTSIHKAGIVGLGPTPAEAAADWGRKFAAGISLPEADGR